MNKIRLVILGKQGAGKGTQAERLARHYGVPRISTGEMFRSCAEEDSETGRIVQKAMEAGDLIPDDLVVKMVAERLTADDTDARGFVLDGFPRTVGQAEALDGLLGSKRVDLAIELQVPTETVLARLAARRVCLSCEANYSTDNPPSSDWVCDECGGKVVPRLDDTEAAIARRLALYEEQTAPLVAWYLSRDRLAAVDGTGPVDTVATRLVRAVDQRLPGAKRRPAEDTA